MKLDLRQLGDPATQSSPPIQNHEGRSFLETVAQFLTSHTAGYQDQLVEHQDSFTLNVDLPGLNKNEIHVEAYENKITIRAAKESRDTYSVEGDMYLRQRTGGIYERTFSLPCSVDKEQIYASYHRGNLEVFMPKLTQPRRIEVQQHDFSPEDGFFDEEWSDKASSLF